MGFYAVAVVLQQGNIKIHISHKITHHAKQNKTPHNATQIINGILQPINEVSWVVQ
jgi:hypothetical protein